MGFLVIAFLLFQLETKIPFWLFVVVFGAVYGIVLNFYRCPVRRFSETDETEKIVVAPADGKIVVIEEVDEHEYFHDRRLMISIFMSLFNVHANWYPINGTVLYARHHSGRHKAAYLPKSSHENERSSVVIESSSGQKILLRQVAGALARRIVTYAAPTHKSQINYHIGFIKFGSRVDLFLPVDSKIFVTLAERTKGNETIIARLPD